MKNGLKKITHKIGLIRFGLMMILAVPLYTNISFAQAQYDGTYVGTWSLTCPGCGDNAAGIFTATLANGSFAGATTFTITSGTHYPRLDFGTVSPSGVITGTGVSPNQCNGSVSIFTGQISTISPGDVEMIMAYTRPGSGTCSAESGVITATRTTTGIVADSKIPLAFTLLQSYPNPCNPATVIEYHMPVSGFVKLSVYDILGREITLLVNENESAGEHRVIFDGNGLPGGIYFYRMQTGLFTETKRLLLLK